MWPFTKKPVRGTSEPRVTVPHPTSLTGQWRLARSDEATLATYGDQAITFTEYGEAVYSEIENDAVVSRTLLQFEIHGSRLKTRKPGDEDVQFARFAISSGRLTLGDSDAMFFPDKEYRSDPLARMIAFASTAIAHGLTSAQAHDPFNPYLICQTSAGRRIFRFSALEIARAAAERKVAELGDKVIAIAWIYERYRDSNSNVNVLGVDVSMRSEPYGLSVAQPYAVSASFVQRVGQMQAARTRSWLSESSPDSAVTRHPLREMMLQGPPPEQMGIEEPALAVMEFLQGETIVSIMGSAHGNASVYFSNGGAILGGVAHEFVRYAANAFVAEVIGCRALLAPTSDFSYPHVGSVRFFLRTTVGVYMAEEQEAALAEGTGALASAYQRGHDVINQLRIASTA